MKKTKENSKKTNFTKLTRSGISLIVLVITIIVIIILAAAIIISLNNNNPIMEANTARYESDCANMQAVFTNAVAKVMAKNQATLTVSPGQINTITGGVKEVDGEVAYTLTDAQNASNSSGKIVFDNNKLNTDTTFYTGKKLPIYAAGETKWYVDEEGNISLEVAGTKYGSGEAVEGGNGGSDETEADPNAVAFAVYSETDNSLRFYKQAQVPSVGVEYNNLTVSYIYENIETINYSSSLYPAWVTDGYTGEVCSVIVEDTIKPISTAYWFNNFIYCDLLNLSKLDTSNVTNMEAMFSGIGAETYSLTIIGMNSWNVSKVEKMNSMFASAAYNTYSIDIGNISNWNTQSLEDSSYMFNSFAMNSYTNFELDLSGWNTSNVTDMSYMFYSTHSNALVFNLVGLENWNTRKVENMESTFQYMNTSGSTIDLSGWDVSSVTNYNNFATTAPYNTTYNIIEPIW